MPGKEIQGKEILGKEVLGKEVLGKEILGKEIQGKEIQGKEVLGKEILGKEIYEAWRSVGVKSCHGEWLPTARVLPRVALPADEALSSRAARPRPVSLPAGLPRPG